MPAETDGAEMAAIMPMTAVTTTISRSVMPRLLALPTDNVGIQSIAAGLAISAETDDVRLVAVLAGVPVNIIVAPGVFGNLLRHVGTGPLVQVSRPVSQRL